MYSSNCFQMCFCFTPGTLCITKLATTHTLGKKLADLVFVYSWTAGPRSAGVLKPVTCPVETGVPVFDLVNKC